MSCDLGRETLGGEQSLVTGGGRGRAEVNKGTLGAAEVSRGRVEDGVVLGEARCPAPGVGEGALVELGSLEDRTGEDSGGRGLFRCWGTRVQIGEAGSQLIPAHSNFDCVSYRPDRTQHCRYKIRFTRWWEPIHGAPWQVEKHLSSNESTCKEPRGSERREQDRNKYRYVVVDGTIGSSATGGRDRTDGGLRFSVVVGHYRRS